MFLTLELVVLYSSAPTDQGRGEEEGGGREEGRREGGRELQAQLHGSAAGRHTEVYTCVVIKGNGHLVSRDRDRGVTSLVMEQVQHSIVELE